MQTSKFVLEFWKNLKTITFVESILKEVLQKDVFRNLLLLLLLLLLFFESASEKLFENWMF